MKLSLVTSIYVNYALEDAIPRIAAAGYDCVDIWGGRPHVYRADYDADGLARLRGVVEKNGLKVAAFLPAFFRYPHNPGSPNDTVRRDSLDYVRHCIDNAAALGAKFVLICPPRLLHGQSVEDGWQRLADSLANLCLYASPYRIKLMLEPVNRAVFDLINTTADAMRMIGQLDRQNLGVVLDTGHLHLSGETIEQALDNLGDRLLMVQVNDNDGIHQQNLVPGDGTFDFPALIAALRQRGYAGVVSAELGADYAMNPDPPVQEAQKRLQQWLF